MKSRQKFKIVPRWETEPRIAIPLQYRAPIARRAPEFLAEYMLQLDQEPWRNWTPLR
jgi:hypothetical protein